MTRQLLTALGTLALAGAVRAAIIVPGANGTDGALNITANTVIDLSQAVTGQWDNDNAANAGKGVYDPAKWAVVFKYTEVNIAAGATVTFKNHTSRAPVVWLVSGNVTVDGAVSLDGEPGPTPPLLADPGPGGFRGGAGIYLGQSPGPGFGVGGGDGSGYDNGTAGILLVSSGGYGTEAVSSHPLHPINPGKRYGNPSLIPLIGGSGGGGSTADGGYSGGAGGGALLCASSGTISVNGSIHATGGEVGRGGGGGSGGGIRLIGTGMSGNGLITAVGAPSRGPGSAGRIRIERIANQGTISVVPDPSVIVLSDGSTALLWPPSGAPEVRVVSIGGVNASEDPRAGFGTIGADVALPITASTQVVIETKNVEQASQVKVRGTPRSNGNFTEVVATVDSIVSNDPLVIRWKADLPVNVGYSAVQARVIRP